MRDLQLQLDDLRYDELVALGRSMIPSLAPGWTDHNVHDPGIMLVELMAWIADAQIYSLGRRPRRDERAAYARLMGVLPEGPAPASGLVWPDRGAATDPSVALVWGRGTLVDVDADVTADVPQSPVFHSTQPVYLTTCRLTGVYAQGSVQNLARINARGGIAWFPFGTAPDAEATLRLEFTAGDARSSPPSARGSAKPVYLSLGVQVAADLERALDSRLSCLKATLSHGRDQWALEVYQDTTHAFGRSGVILLAVDPAVMPLDDAFTLTLRCQCGVWLTTPKVRQILPNVVAVVQRQVREWQMLGNTRGLPNEVLSFPNRDANEVQFGGDAAAVKVRVGDGNAWLEWHVVPSFERSSPADPHVVVDFETSTLTFGNGVNGQLAPAGASAQASYCVSEGVLGNVSAGASWHVAGIAGAFGTNMSAMRGGRDASTPEDLQVRARARVRNERPLVSSADLEEAASQLPGFGVTRAMELPVVTVKPATPPACPRSSSGTAGGAGAAANVGFKLRSPGQRRLVVVGTHLHGLATPSSLETTSWLAAIRRQLAPRLPLGQSLDVLAPRYTPFCVRAVLVAHPRVALDIVAKRVSDELVRRFALSSTARDAGWPFGRGVSARAISGWLRKLDGVAQVTQVVLITESGATNAIDLPRTGLPLFQATAGDIQMTSTPSAARRTTTHGGDRRAGGAAT